VADDETDPPSTVQPRATDFLSAAVESRARAASAIVSGDRLASAIGNPFKTPLSVKGAPLLAMEADEDSGLKLRPTKPPVQPVAKADLLPSMRLNAEQEEILARIAPAPSVSQKSPGVAPAERPQAETGRAPPSSPSVLQSARRTRSVEMPEPGEPSRPRREFYAAEWDRYYNPGMFAQAKIPRMTIGRAAAPPGAPAWTMVGKPKGAGVVVTSQAPYRASLKEGARVKDLRPQKEVAKFIAHREGEGAEFDLPGPGAVPDEREGGERPDDAENARRAEFESAMADLERSFEESRASTGAPERPPRPGTLASPRAAPAPAAAAAVAKAAERAMPFPRTSTSGPPTRALSRSRSDMADEDDADISAEDEEEPTLGRSPPPDRRAEEKAHRALQHDGSGAALCPTCGRRITPSNQVLVCSSCGRVSCGSCGKFSAGQPTGNIYQYEYKFNFPLCQPCFDRHFNIQKNLARAKAYLASGNLTYAFYHAQSARQLEPESPYKADAEELVVQVEARRTQMQAAEKQWDDARRKMMKERTTVLK